MIRLLNLEKNNNSTIECDIIPEDSTVSGHIVVDTNEKQIKECSLPEGYEWCKNHVNHARKRLIELAELDEFEKEYLIMWY